MLEAVTPQNPKPKRIVAIDLLRGYFLFMIMVDHLAKYPSGLEYFTGKGVQWVSAAEGFFLISGILVGFVYGRRMERTGFPPAWKKVWRRAAVLYAWSVGLTLFFTLWGRLAPMAPGLKWGLQSADTWPHVVWQALQLHYIYGWADFLPYYAVFLAWSPLALWAIHRKRAWAVPPVTLAVWLLRGTSFTMAWQILFMNGIVIGYYLPDIEEWVKSWKSWARRFVFAATGVLVAITMFFSNEVVEHGRYHGLPADKVWQFFDKTDLGPGRVGLAFAAFLLIYGLFRKFEGTIKRWLGWFLLPLGQNSLYVYIVHSFVVFGLLLAFPGSYGRWENILLNLAVVGAVWAVVRSRLLFRFMPH